MSAPLVRACLRCHSKKVKCSGYPDCLGCKQAQIRCEAYVRPRRHENLQALREAHSRIRWLQDECLKELGVDCTSFPTGTPLRAHRRQDRVDDRIDNAQPSASGSVPASESAPSRPSLNPESPKPPETPATNDAPEASLLALNASGELKYLGASSGAFFASYAAALVRSCTSNRQPRLQAPVKGVNDATPSSTSISDAPKPLTQDEIQLLLRSYEMWVHPLYPLLDLDILQDLVSRHGDSLVDGWDETSTMPYSQSNIEMTILYQVMALGATNRSNTIKQLRLDRSDLVDRVASTPAPSPASLCAASLSYLESCLGHLHASLEFVQMLLLFCIYSSYGPVGSSQWQLAGLAMRMAVEIGLHHDSRRWYASEQDVNKRRRVFWTAYAIEVTLAYNLGRPPSISGEHITTKLPKDSSDVRLGVLHIKHRQIQGRIMSGMYRASSQASMKSEERQSMIAELQTELDQWRLSIPQSSVNEMPAPYPTCYWDRLYHSTSFVLHRTGPLSPQPSPKSLQQCIRSAGAYIDSVAQVLRSSNVPQSWMLIQGVVLAGLTMLVSARTNFRKLASGTDLALLLVELPSWSRKCSVCLAIMNERWNEDLLTQLETHFEILSDDTLKFISTSLTAERQRVISRETSAMDVANVVNVQATGTSGLPAASMQPNAFNQSVAVAPNADDNGLTADWDHLSIFSGFLGVDFMDTYWDTYDTDAGLASTCPSRSHPPDSDSVDQGVGLFDGW